MYKINKIDDFQYVTFPLLEEYEELFHCFTTRKGGVSSGNFATMNLGFKTGDSKENVEANYNIMAEKLNIKIENIVQTKQTHTNNILYVTEKDKGRAMTTSPYTDIDGIYTDRKDIALMSFHADCSAVFFYDSVKKFIGLAHAGWRGTVENIVGVMIKAFVQMGSNPANIKAAIGPSLGQCCFEVDEDVAHIFLETNSSYENFMVKKGKKYHFDLWEINKYNMVKEGMNEENIEVSGLCTKCHNHLFFSHRGQKGKRGLMAGIIMMKN
ncbi:MAG TPA: peptidoglycan editing factor PgeF [Tissierellia bacterium]|jgi:YfiH family protein|nr:peptidoglycan editing factor PgeF [Tissierellia bacterium]